MYHRNLDASQLSGSRDLALPLLNPAQGPAQGPAQLRLRSAHPIYARRVKTHLTRNRQLLTRGPKCLPPRLQVNRGTCRFGRYKYPRRAHPPPRASRVSHHPPQVSGLTLAHPCSSTLTRSRPPPSARPIDSGCACPFLDPGQRGRNGLPRRCRFWVATHMMVD